MKRPILGGLVVALALTGCADMNPTQQRALSGTAIGAGVVQSSALSPAMLDSVPVSARSRVSPAASYTIK
jgi:hypothetical protein